MEHNEETQNGLLDELVVAPKLDTYWTTFAAAEANEISPNVWNCDSFHRNHLNQDLVIPNEASSSLSGLFPQSGFAFPFAQSSSSYPFLDHVDDGFLTTFPAEFGSNCDILPPVPIQQTGYEAGVLAEDVGHDLGLHGLCKVEAEKPAACSIDASRAIAGISGDKRSKIKKAEGGQPSKNLMAERRRRKRLNDRLSMLRSIVPKITKMDRTSILGDTIDYMKELLDKIHKFREDSEEEDIILRINKMGNLKQLKPDEVLARNTPKFDVERRSADTLVEISCTPKSGMLLSTVSTLEALGLDIQQCVISCFNDFSVQASCSEVAEHRNIIGSEDVKQVLCRNAGYGGRCL